MVNKFKNLKKTRKISFIFVIAVILFSHIFGFLSIIAFYNISYIISDTKIPDGLIILNLDIYNPENMETAIPYSIQNRGIYNLNHLFIETEIFVNYIDRTNGKNITSKIFSKAGALPQCSAYNSIEGYFSGDFSQFNITALLEFNLGFDLSKPIRFLTNIKFQSKYFFNLIDFSIILNNVDLTGS